MGMMIADIGKDMNYSKLFGQIREKSKLGTEKDIDEILELLNDDNLTIPITKAVDFYLGQVTNPEGIARIEYYLFSGTQIQRNYCTLFFARRHQWDLVDSACRLGLIDRIQAYSR
jgi:hypothetical protein